MTADLPTFIPAGYARRGLPRHGSLLVHRRSMVITAALLGAGLSVALITIVTGPYDITSAGVVNTILGGGSEIDRFIVLGQRLPRALAALLVGAALGASGSIFQSISRNPLGSPDIIGFTTGAATGGLVVILLADTAGSSPIVAGTLVGGAATALVVIAFTLRGGLTGDRLVLSGIAIGAMLAAVNDYLISRASIEAAETARNWQHGSLNAIGWLPITPLAVSLALALPAALAMSRSLRALELGDDAAAGTGVATNKTRAVAIMIGIVLAGVAVATAGPIGFLALAAPQLARRIAAAPGLTIGTSAAMGAVLLAVADLLAQRLLSPFQIPVGLITAAVGGGYLIWLLAIRPGSRSAGGAR